MRWISHDIYCTRMRWHIPINISRIYFQIFFLLDLSNHWFLFFILFISVPCSYWNCVIACSILFSIPNTGKVPSNTHTYFKHFFFLYFRTLRTFRFRLQNSRYSFVFVVNNYTDAICLYKFCHFLSRLSLVNAKIVYGWNFVCSLRELWAYGVL